DNLEFAIGSDVISPSSFESLDLLVDLLNKRPEYRIYIAGHTDNTGNEKKNQKLSENRAKSVSIYLQSHGINPTRIKTEGFGSSRPVETNKTPEGRQKNRRVEFRVIK
ncbi:MAG: OmpA family protein, partial [Bacteroidota bacterium]|nr:OmpA family protein [Bacteroidota bacterium]MDX5431917.1 OmpA family protein [Bacteroidota bacterium]MDX5470632.1 OmpA family protein [Bacteroidota bacterium]